MNFFQEFRTKTKILLVVSVVALVLGNGIFWWEVFQNSSMSELPKEKVQTQEPLEPDAMLSEDNNEIGTQEVEGSTQDKQELPSNLATEESSTESIKIGPQKIQEATFLITWEEGAIDATLVAPDGTIFRRELENPSMYHEKGSKYQLYRIQDPQVGDWTVQLYRPSWSPSGFVTVQTSQIPEDLDPEVSIQYPTPIVLGEEYEFLTTFEHPGKGRKPHTAVITWGDGTEETAEVKGGQVGAVSATHTYASIGNFPVGICIIDVKGRKGCDTAELTVGLAPPIMEFLPPQKIALGEPFTVETTYTSEGPKGKHEASVYWKGGDEESVEGKTTLIEQEGGGVVRTTHTFTEPAPYEYYVGIICVTYEGALQPNSGRARCSEVILTYEGGKSFE